MNWLYSGSHSQPIQIDRINLNQYSSGFDRWRADNPWPICAFINRDSNNRYEESNPRSISPDCDHRIDWTVQKSNPFRRDSLKHVRFLHPAERLGTTKTTSLCEAWKLVASKVSSRVFVFVTFEFSTKKRLFWKPLACVTVSTVSKLSLSFR